MATARLGLVEVEDLTWRPYGRREPVLREVRLTLRPGERVLLAGPSGAGKSTLLRALTGLLGSAEAGELTGSVTLDGAPPGSRPGATGLVLQEPGSGVVAATVALASVRPNDVAFVVAVSSAHRRLAFEVCERLVEEGKVRINRERTIKPSQSVRVGDVLTIAVGPRVRVLEVKALGSRRGPAPEAQALYEDRSPPMTATAPQPTGGERPSGAGRPTKRDRRQIDRLTEPD